MESKNTNLEFLIVGIARESQEDLHKFYKATAPEVYGMALSIVKDTYLASEVLAETHKRIATMAYLFNTEMSAEYWLLDMAKNISENALHDPDIKISHVFLDEACYSSTAKTETRCGSMKLLEESTHGPTRTLTRLQKSGNSSACT